MRKSNRQASERAIPGDGAGCANPRAAFLTRQAVARSAPTACIVEPLESRVLYSTAHGAAAHSIPAVPTGWHASPVVPIHRIAPTLAGSGANASGSSSPYGLTPAQMLGAYGVSNISFGGTAGNGAGQTIAIIDAYNDPTITADLHSFDAYFGLADPPSFQVLNQTGGTTLPGTDPAGPYSSTGAGDWEEEESLDVEWAHVMAPNANIILFEASNAGSGLYTAVGTARSTAGVTVVSMSWGGSEFSGESAYDAAYFSTPSGHIGAGGVAGGITFLASTGDNGAGLEYPAASPNVVGVGGTSLTVSGTSYGSESGWSGSGGGISSYESQPAYQNGIVTQSTTKRTVPDVSIDANPNTGVPIYDSYDFGASTPWVPGYEGGTSLACPMWAGLIALSDQDRALSGLGSLNGGTQTLPQLYKLPSSDFHDITTGSNGYAAGTGYDLVTGIGSPVANSLVPDLANVPTPTPTPTPTATLTISGAASVSEGTSYALNLSASDPGQTISSWSINWGDGSTQSVTGNPSSVTHTYATGPNTYAISAAATDGVGTYTSNTQTVSVTHVPPVLSISGASSVAEESPYTLSLSASDPGHAISGWSINWGDGTTQAVTGNPASVTHTYATGPNSYTISATAADNVGTYSAGNSVAVSVTHVPPVLTISGASSVAEQSAYTLSLSDSDPGHTINSWTINWGDGATQTVAGNPSSVVHTYASGPNNYTISATATDDVSTYSAGNPVAVSVTHVPPVLAISGASSVAEQSAYTLSLSGSDPGHAISGWSINWGDGTTQAVTGDPASVTHTYATGPNSYTISAIATDNVGTYSAGNSVAVSVTHVPPELTISGASSVAEQSAYTLSLSDSDPGHTISSWTINWGDGATQTVAGNPSSVVHTYASGPNNYTISATATDDVGAYPANTQAVSVTHVPPVLAISGASSVAEGSAYTLDLSDSDPGHTISEWSINWGDRTTQTVTGNPSSVTHTYGTGPNSYSISATATDDVGTYPAGNSVAVNVTHVPPVLTISGASSVAEDSAYTLDLSGSDPGHTISSWSINWGDGTTQAVTENATSVQHTYATGPNGYTISAAATDDVGTYSAGNSVAVSVTHVPPVLTISGASSVAEQSAFTLNLSASDPGHTISGWSINWGDGTTQEVTGNPASVTHTYATGPNGYTITAAATDDVGTYPAGNSVPVSVTHVPPVLTISGASSVAEQSAFTLNLSASDPGHTISGWSINWGDGTTQEVTGNPASVTHTYATGPNGYTISATATDDVGTYSAGNSVAVSVTHVPPVLTISGASSVAGQSAFTLNLSAYDPGHTISSWNINWGDGTTEAVTGNPASVTHTYATGPNSYTITATAADNVSTYAAGNSVAVSLTHVPPVLIISGASSVAEQSPYTLSLSASDPGHPISGWSINWGDGTTQPVTGSPSSVTHTYATGPNSYTISATATDNVGTYPAGNSVSVSVTHVPPTLAVSGAPSVAEGSAYALNLSDSDPGHTISSWSINWGDGTTQNITGNPASVQHTYATGPNSYTISATATDDVGAYAANSQGVSVTHVPPVLAISGPGTAAEETTYALNLSASDPGHTINSWSINWGDGTIVTVTGNPSSVEHVYTLDGSYQISATATDDVGTYPAAKPSSLLVALAIGSVGKTTLGQTGSLTASAGQALYQVTISQLANLAVALTGKKQKLSLVLLDAQMNPVQALGGKKSLSLSRRVAPGTYFLKVDLSSTLPTAFTLKLSAKPVAPPKPSKRTAVAAALARWWRSH